MSRQEFSRKTRAAIFARAAGKCEKCNAVLKTGEGEVDHILPCALGGEPTVANGRLICRVCHKEKTAADIRRVRASDRQRDKATGAVRPAGKLKGQGFPPAAKSARPPKDDLPPLPYRRLYGPAQPEAKP